ncbi:MAG: PRC-barrel domain-containing protein [Thermoleophilia bacterium]|jgi:hypothetical protein|nr:PRC-barrel domain-containing protein [Thermoleophilia bacterium]
MSEGSHAPADLVGRVVRSADGTKLGKVDAVLVDRAGAAHYAEVESGWFGRRRHVVPVRELTPRGEELIAPWDRQHLHAAPTLAEHEAVTYDHEQVLGRHYGHLVPDWDEAAEDAEGPTPEVREVMEDPAAALADARAEERMGRPGGTTFDLHAGAFEGHGDGLPTEGATTEPYAPERVRLLRWSEGRPTA